MYTAPLQNHKWLFVDRADGRDDELEEESVVLDEGTVETRFGGRCFCSEEGGGWVLVGGVGDPGCRVARGAPRPSLGGTSKGPSSGRRSVLEKGVIDGRVGKRSEQKKPAAAATTGLGYRTPDRWMCTLDKFYQREMVRRWASNAVFVVGQEIPRGPLFRPEVVHWPGVTERRLVLERMVRLRSEEVMGLLPFRLDYVTVDEVREDEEDEDWAEGVVWRGRRVWADDGLEKERLPMTVVEEGEQEPIYTYVFQLIRHLVVNTTPSVTALDTAEVYSRRLGQLKTYLQQSAAVSQSSPTNEFDATQPNFLNPPSSDHNHEAWVYPSLSDSDIRILQQAHLDEKRLPFIIDYSKLPNLETLCLDLRGLSYPPTAAASQNPRLRRPKAFLTERAVCSKLRDLWYRGLKLLVIAGLRSWNRYPGPEPEGELRTRAAKWDGRRCSYVNEQGEVDWWAMLRRCVRPGGKVVLVDVEGEEVGAPFQ